MNASVVIDNSIFLTLTVVSPVNVLLVGKMTDKSNVMKALLLGIS